MNIDIIRFAETFNGQAFDETYEDLLRRNVIEESTTEIYNALRDLWIEAWEYGRDRGREDRDDDVEDARGSGYEDGFEAGHVEGYDSGHIDGMEEADAG